MVQQVLIVGVDSPFFSEKRISEGFKKPASREYPPEHEIF
jgi:hypothetical protein